MDFESVYSEYCSNGMVLGDKMCSFIQRALQELRYTPSGSKAPTKDDLLGDVVVTLMNNDHQKLRHIMSASAVGMHNNLPVLPEVVLSRLIKTIIKHCIYDEQRKGRDTLHNLSDRIISAVKKDPYCYKDVRASGRSWLVSPSASAGAYPSDDDLERSFRNLVLDCSKIPKLPFVATRASPIYKGVEFDLLCKTLTDSIPAFVKSDIYRFLTKLLPDWGSGSVREEDRKSETTEGLDDMARQIATDAVALLDARSRTVISIHFSLENPLWAPVAMATQTTEYPVDRKAAKQIIFAFGESLKELANDYTFNTEEMLEKAVGFLPELLFPGKRS